MKLNRNGWGMSSMIAFCGCLSFCLLLVAILYNQKLSIDSFDSREEMNETVVKSNVKKTESVNLDKYYELEELIAKKIENELKGKLSYGKIILTFADIEENIDLEKIKIEYQEFEKCSGYVIYEGKTNQAKAYLNCRGTYQSPNYNIDFE